MWLRYGECLNVLSDIEGAVRAYTRVVELAPGHLGARMSLSALQQQLGKHQEAIDALDRGESLFPLVLWVIILKLHCRGKG